jgi:WD40 repeat protein
VRSIPLPSSHDVRTSRIAWSPSHRILVFDDETTRAYDLRDDKWSAVISNGSGGMGKNVHVEFGATDDEVLVWSDFAACLKIWCLKTGRAVEIRDAKFPGRDGKGWGYRPSDTGSSSRSRGQVMALLCRSSGIDVLLLLSAPTYTLLSRVELPTTDAANLKWSRDGRWLAVWDAASAGYTLHMYTADGHLYRTITREPSDETDAWGIEGLGIKSVEWVPGNEKLAVGGWDRRVRILSTRTFAPLVFLDHTSVIHVSSAPVYTEHMDGQGNKSYMLTPQPATAPKAPLEKNETALMKQGISLLAFNRDGTLCATRDDSTPSTVWIWDLSSLQPRTILVQYAPVKTLQWHSHDPNRLLIQTTSDAPVVYLYTAHTLSSSATSSSSTAQRQPPPPEILDLAAHLTKPASPVPARWTTSWLATAEDKKPVLWLGHQHGYVLAWPEGKDQILRFEHDDVDESDDSLYDILTGRTPVPQIQQNSHLDEELPEDDTIEALDDTFREKRGRGNSEATNSRGRGVLDESGMDEMF